MKNYQFAMGETGWRNAALTILSFNSEEEARQHAKEYADRTNTEVRIALVFGNLADDLTATEKGEFLGNGIYIQPDSWFN